MEDIKVMPYSEKYGIVQDYIDFTETFMIEFVEDHLGDQAVHDLQMLYQEGIEPIPKEASLEEKYETAYRNWIWIGKSNFNFIRKKMGEEGIAQLERKEVEALKRKNASPTLYLLSFIRAFSPGTAFKMTVKEFAYQLQWITPGSMSDLTQHKAVFNIPRCKILDYQGIDDLCHIGCQSIYPKWFAEQFKVRTKFDPKEDKSCVCILTPYLT